VVDVDEIGAVGTQERVGLEGRRGVIRGSGSWRSIRGLCGAEMRPPSMEAKIRYSESTRSIRCWERIRILMGWVEACLGAESWETNARGARSVLVWLRFLFLRSGWLWRGGLSKGLIHSQRHHIEGWTGIVIEGGGEDTWGT